MKRNYKKYESKKVIDSFFLREDFSPEELKKIKRLAMKHNIKLAGYKKLFCKKCFSKLRGKLSVSKTHKSVICRTCGFRNKSKII